MFREKMISVILPVYNVEQYLEDCLNSLLAQTFKDFELIAVNDGSTDNSLSILSEYKSKFKYYELISHENRGLSEARNSGLKHVDGKYIYFLDSDDYLLPNTFENLVKMAEEHSLDLIKFDANPFSEIQGNFKMSNYDTSNVLNENTLYSKDEYLKAVKRRFMPPVWLYFIKSSIIMDNKLTFKKGILHEDELFTVQLLKHCNRIMYDSNKYFQRRYRANSIMTKSLGKNNKSYDSKVEIINLFSDLQRLERSKSEYYKFLQSRKNVLYTSLLFYKFNTKSELIKLLVRNSNSNLDLKTFIREFRKRILV
ncbi:glycosyltransferase [Neobacillus cucumis]|uniref:glycosyltransferase n=1 Tax=Neobacillus cucumis TaxID=1740721 RepID=UPI002E1CEF1C|nr:glycosyltransferase [Neobacillus cucumis]